MDIEKLYVYIDEQGRLSRPSVFGHQGLKVYKSLNRLKKEIKNNDCKGSIGVLKLSETIYL